MFEFFWWVSVSYILPLSARTTPTDLHIYNPDAVPPIHVVSNHVDTDKLTTANGKRLRQVQPVA